MGKEKHSENEVEIAACHYFKSKKLFLWKQPQSGYYDAARKCFRKQTSIFARNGIPDILMVYKGHFIGVEMKSSTGTQSSEQKLFESDLRSFGGGLYFVCRSLEDAKNIYLAIINLYGC